jgi:hypothetical protein
VVVVMASSGRCPLRQQQIQNLLATFEWPNFVRLTALSFGTGSNKIIVDVMRMDVQVNSEYEDLNPFVRSIPGTFSSIPQIIENRRNIIRVCSVGRRKVVIKSFEGMYFTNWIAYSLFRKSKAKRSYEISLELRSKGFIVPTPIAFVDCYRWGLLVQSYFVSLYYEHISFNEMLSNERIEETFLWSLAEFTRSLHLADVYHKDYSNGNILCNYAADKITFGLVDLNRVRFRKVNFSQGIKNFSKLTLSESGLALLLNRYAASSGRPIGDAMTAVLKERDRRILSAAWRNRAKSIFFPGRLRRAKAAKP